MTFLSTYTPTSLRPSIFFFSETHRIEQESVYLEQF